jgi:hypothetical protein
LELADIAKQDSRKKQQEKGFSELSSALFCVAFGCRGGGDGGSGHSDVTPTAVPTATPTAMPTATPTNSEKKEGKKATKKPSWLVPEWTAAQKLGVDPVIYMAAE